MRIAIATLLALSSVASSARASEIGPDGRLSFAADALATCSFESLADLTAAGAAWIDWSSAGRLVPRALAPADVGLLLAGEDGALEGGHGLLVREGLGAGVALRLPALARVSGGRFSVSVWGRAHGAEPVLEVVYAHDDHAVGPSLPRVLAIRTGRETSDGWVEYATGPVDGAVLTAPARAVVLSARYATRAGASMLIGGDRSPTAPASSPILDPSAYAVVDAVEVRPEAGDAASPAATCTQATVDTACGADHECQFGHCVDAAMVWGPVPAAAEHRRDLVARWAFVAQHLHADRQATAAAATAFAGVEDALSPLVSPRSFYGGLGRIVAGIRDSHTNLGTPPSSGSVVYPIPDSRSGPLDLCFGVATNDLAAGEQVYAVFAVGDGPSVRTDLRRGDVLTAVDGMPAEAWIAAVLPRFVSHRPNDPAADPSSTALLLPKLLGRFATTLTFSRCRAGGRCAALPDVSVAAPLYAEVARTLAYTGSTRVCSPRFHPAVASPPPDSATADTVVYQTVTGVTSVQFNGFEARFSPIEGWHAWEDPWTAVLAGKTPVVVDARLGHGGKFALGRWLFHLLRGSAQPYGVFAMPRGAYDDPDPPWLFAPRWDTCAAGDEAPDACAWTGGQSCFTGASSPGEGARMAWINGSDVSMNDIVPRLLSGRASFRVFGPHPSQGAYGEISALPPIEPTWGHGSLQVLDMRFGPTPAEARAAPWESGKGVVPDELVAQKVSDILADRDTVLEAAIAWVSQ